MEDFNKVNTDLDKLYTAQGKRLEAEEKERRQQELAEQAEQAARDLLQGYFRKKDLERIMNDDSMPEEERTRAEEEIA